MAMLGPSLLAQRTVGEVEWSGRVGGRHGTKQVGRDMPCSSSCSTHGTDQQRQAAIKFAPYLGWRRGRGSTLARPDMPLEHSLSPMANLSPPPQVTPRQLQGPLGQSSRPPVQVYFWRREERLMTLPRPFGSKWFVWGGGGGNSGDREVEVVCLFILRAFLGVLKPSQIPDAAVGGRGWFTRGQSGVWTKWCRHQAPSPETRLD